VVTKTTKKRGNTMQGGKGEVNRGMFKNLEDGKVALCWARTCLRAMLENGGDTVTYGGGCSLIEKIQINQEAAQ